MPNIHPLVVHFPIALLTMALVFDLLGAYSEKREFERVGWWGMVAGVLGLAAAILSGLRAESAMEMEQSVIGTFEQHEQTAFVVAGIFCGLLFWRMGTGTLLPQRFRTIFLSLYLFGTLLMWLGAWYGGILVYHYGLGVGGS